MGSRGLPEQERPQSYRASAKEQNAVAMLSKVSLHPTYRDVGWQDRMSPAFRAPGRCDRSWTKSDETTVCLSLAIFASIRPSTPGVLSNRCRMLECVPLAWIRS